MKKLIRLLRYEWPLHFVLVFTNFLPDNVIFLKLRGRLAAPFFKKCGSNLELGRNISFYNCSQISIGSNVYIAFGCWLNGKIEIQDEVMLGPYCVLVDSNHMIGESNSYRFGNSTSGEIIIGSGSWLGAKATVVGNVKMGGGTLLAAHAVLTRDCAQNSVLGGLPAKNLKK
jgi:acetyltransferase-like isoleucine patch superfamily enzyme